MTTINDTTGIAHLSTSDDFLDVACDAPLTSLVGPPGDGRPNCAICIARMGWKVPPLVEQVQFIKEDQRLREDIDQEFEHNAHVDIDDVTHAVLEGHAQAGRTKCGVAWFVIASEPRKVPVREYVNCAKCRVLEREEMIAQNIPEEFWAGYVKDLSMPLPRGMLAKDMEEFHRAWNASRTTQGDEPT